MHFNEDVLGRTKPVVSPDYIVGLTDGEGCFFVNTWKSSSYKVGYCIQLQFHIKMQEKDKPLLEKVKNTLGCGAIYFQKEKRTNHCQCYRYSVYSYKDILETIIPFFQQNPLQSVSKLENFEIFCQIALLVKAKEHLAESGVEKIKTLKQKMNLKTTTGLA